MAYISRENFEKSNSSGQLNNDGTKSKETLRSKISFAYFPHI